MTSSSGERILVTGATGVLGRAVVSELIQRGVTVRGTGRSETPKAFSAEWCQCDLLQSASVKNAFRDVTTAIHCASTPFALKDERQALSNLLHAAKETSVHLVYVSIAGIEAASRVFEYYRVKLESEAAIQASGIPYTIVRISQFHPFIDMILRRISLGPFVFRPPLNLQPIDVPFAARELASHAMQRTSGRTKDLHGPEALDERAVLEAWRRAQEQKKFVIPIPGIGPLKAFGLIETVGGDTGGRTWSEWLSSEDASNNPYLS